MRKGETNDEQASVFTAKVNKSGHKPNKINNKINNNSLTSKITRSNSKSISKNKGKRQNYIADQKGSGLAISVAP